MQQDLWNDDAPHGDPIAMDLWDAPSPRVPLHATVEVPGSKSQTNRLLVLAALADSPSVIHGALRSRDTDLMIAALNSLGAEITAVDSLSTLNVTPLDLNSPVTTDIDVGLAGTVMRFVPPVAALVGGTIKFDGDEAARVRPMKGLLDALVQLGVSITYDGETGFLPFTMENFSSSQIPEVIIVDSSATSQYISGLLLSAPKFQGGLIVEAVGEVPSRPHIDMTVEALRERGVQVDDDTENRWVVHPGSVAGGEMWVEPDLSNASPFLAAALVTGGSVSVPGWPGESTQPGIMVPKLLEQMGGSIRKENVSLTVTGSGHIHGIDIDLSAAGELVPTFAALAALASTPSRFTGIGHLRGHETDRLAALVTEINRLGGDARELPDGIEINPKPLHVGVWHTYKDHRMATAGAIVGLRVPGVKVENIGTTAKTLPDFVNMWGNMVDAPAVEPVETIGAITQ